MWNYKKNSDDKKIISLKSVIENKYEDEKCFRYNKIKKFFNEVYESITREIYISVHFLCSKN